MVLLTTKISCYDNVAAAKHEFEAPLSKITSHQDGKIFFDSKKGIKSSVCFLFLFFSLSKRIFKNAATMERLVIYGLGVSLPEIF